MRIVVALGGNALLQRGQRADAGAQRENVAVAVKALAELAADHEVIVTHGTGRRSVCSRSRARPTVRRSSLIHSTCSVRRAKA